MRSYAGIAAVEGAEEYGHQYVPRCRYEQSVTAAVRPAKVI